jgi:hypothetical protein
LFTKSYPSMDKQGNSNKNLLHGLGYR